MVSIEWVAIGFLIYNVIAFGFQPIIGFLCDENPKIRIAWIGCVLVIIGLVCSTLFPWAGLIMSAIGNACFHVGGGINSLKYAKGKMSRSGVFVSTGALGVATGTMVGQTETLSIMIPIMLMVVAFLLLIVFAKDKDEVVMGEFKVASKLPFATVLIIILISIMIRSYGGGMFPMNWKIATDLWLLPSMGAFSGKLLGGIVGDRFGAKRVGVISLVLSIPFLLLGNEMAIVSLIGIVLFNITMPITLCAVASKFPYHPGLAFGLTTLALLCGSTVTYFVRVSQELVYFVLSAFIIVSALCIFISTNNQKGEMSYEDPV